MVGFCWKFGSAFCGFDDDPEECKPGAVSDWQADDEEQEYHKSSSKISALEDSIAEKSQLRQEKRHRYRLTVFARQVNATECPRTSKKTKKESDFLHRVLREDRKFIFCDFTDKEQGFMLDVLRKDDTVKKGDILYSAGDIGDFFYIIEQGQVEILWPDNTPTTTLKNGDSFGEVALLFDVPRAATARAKTDCVLWKMHQHCFRGKLAHHALTQEEGIMDLLRRVELFVNMDDATLRKFANALELVHFAPDERIVNKGDEGKVFYIIDQGQVRIHAIGAGDSKQVDITLKGGEWFGERSLLTGEPRAANATALTKVAAWAVDRDTFENSFGPLQQVIQHEMKKSFLKAIPSFAQSDINPSELDTLADMMQELCLKAGHHIDEVGKPYRQVLVVIEHGRISLYDGKGEDGGKVFSIQSGDYYGDKHIRDEPGKLSCYNVVCEENTTVWSISRSELLSVIGDLDRLGQSVSFEAQRKSNYKARIQQKEVEKIKVLGHGGFGKVWLVKHKETNQHYALKELNKRQILDRNQAQNVMREREILATLNHPFILGQVSSFQDETSLYILMDLIRGGELYNLIVGTEGKGLPVEDAVFYAACIHSALAHFHARLIAYRDLKPENVMLDKDGYCVLVDLGFAKVITTKTFTLCGTPEYLAPEILMSKGHDKAVDQWAFGVLIYELLTCRSPFYRQGDKQVEMFKRIVKSEYKVPPTVKVTSEDIIQRLLVRNPAKRLGNLSNGSEDVRAHPWFKSIDWKLLRKKEIKAPWIPEIKEGAAVADSHIDFSEGAYQNLSFGRALTAGEQSIFKTF
ncbi:Protein kinase 4 (Fragment) [Seminavis robusta]|uniref:cGMP-dependent protein kinase n=1 Tax=Seminavis robusta TaxID=568900 RepID=A0A9N8EJX6_9STRA